MDSTERRRAKRVRFVSTAILRYGDNLTLEARVDTHNISLKGVFVETDVQVPLQTLCTIKIRISGTTSAMDVHAKGIIQRQEPSGLGIAFTHLDPDSYLHIFNLVELHAAE